MGKGGDWADGTRGIPRGASALRQSGGRRGVRPPDLRERMEGKPASLREQRLAGRMGRGCGEGSAGHLALGRVFVYNERTKSGVAGFCGPGRPLLLGA